MPRLETLTVVIPTPYMIRQMPFRKTLRIGCEALGEAGGDAYSTAPTRQT